MTAVILVPFFFVLGYGPLVLVDALMVDGCWLLNYVLLTTQALHRVGTELPNMNDYLNLKRARVDTRPFLSCARCMIAESRNQTRRLQVLGIEYPISRDRSAVLFHRETLPRCIELREDSIHFGAHGLEPNAIKKKKS